MSLFLKTLIVAGGGGGGGGGKGGTTDDQNGGGGGGGGVIFNDAVAVAAGAYSIVVGAGGVQSTARDTNGGNGGDSSAFGLTATGGGGGGSGESPGDTQNSQPGNDGGSGGGAGGNESDGDKPGGNGVTGQGFDGGTSDSTTNNGLGGGGGGGSEVGGDGAPTLAGAGGDGFLSSISGASLRYGGGGGGQSSASDAERGAAGAGGGGIGGGQNRSTSNPGNGTDGLGGGGGGGSRGSSSNSNYTPSGGSGRGGSGVVIISYVTSEFGVCTGGTKTTDGANTVHTFTSDGTFTVFVLPDVETFTVTDVDKTTATGNGSVVSDGGETIIEMGIVYDVSPNPTISDTKVLASNAVGPFSVPITGLSDDTLYYVRAFLTLGSGTYYGNEITFTTLPPISLTTYAPTEITQTTALANGEIFDDGGNAITERGFVWDTAPDPTTADDKVIVAGTIGAYSGEMDSLTADTLYYVRAYAINSEGTSYGQNRTFTTASTLARVGALDTGFMDYDTPIYFEMIDRWRAFTTMYAKSKAISGINFYTENAAGVRTYFQAQKSPPNVWEDLGTITEENNALFPNAQTKDFDVGRLRFAGFTSGTPVVFHSMEILSINDKGFDSN